MVVMVLLVLVLSELLLVLLVVRFGECNSYLLTQQGVIPFPVF